MIIDSDPTFRVRGGGLVLLFLQSKTIDIGELRRDVLAVFLGGLEARLFNCLQRFFIEAGAATFRDFRLCHFAFRVDFNS